MKLTRTLLLGLMVVFFARAVLADTVQPGDPKIKTGGASSGGAVVPNDSSMPAIIVTSDFMIVSPSGASPASSPCELYQFGHLTASSPNCLFENGINPSGTGLAITQLIFDVGGVNPSTVGCGFLAASPFSMCTSVGIAPTEAQVTFFDGSIPFGNEFTLQLGGLTQTDPGTPADRFPTNTNFNTTAPTVPEPGTLAMFFTGIGALLIGRRLRAL